MEHPPLAGRATINDVARLANVARTTVSRVINRTGYTSPAVRARVEAVIEELEYRPRMSAQSLRRGTFAIADVIVEDPADQFTARVIHGVAMTAADHGVAMKLTLAKSAITADADGYIYVASRGDVAPEIENLRRWAPTVLVGEPSRWTDVSALVVDPSSVAIDIARGATRRGHRRILIVKERHPQWVTTQYATSLAVGLVRAGLTPHSFDEVTVESSIAAGRLAAEHTLRRPRLEGTVPTAFLCVTDEIARGVLEFCRARGLTNSPEIAVTGFGGSREAEAIGLTTAALPAERLGRLAVHELIRRSGADRTPASTRTLPATIVE